MILRTLKQNTKRRQDQGFVILYAILLTTVVLTIGLSLLGVLIQQVSLSGTERESVSAFTASDSGIECGAYWDAQNAFRNTVTGDVTCKVKSISCGGNTITVSDPVTSATSYPGITAHTCSFTVTFPNNDCASVSVEKTTEDASPPPAPTPHELATTTIQSKGYNTICPENGASPKPWRLERGLETVY